MEGWGRQNHMEWDDERVVLVMVMVAMVMVMVVGQRRLLPAVLDAVDAHSIGSSQFFVYSEPTKALASIEQYTMWRCGQRYTTDIDDIGIRCAICAMHTYIIPYIRMYCYKRTFYMKIFYPTEKSKKTHAQ